MLYSFQGRQLLPKARERMNIFGEAPPDGAAGVSERLGWLLDWAG